LATTEVVLRPLTKAGDLLHVDLDEVPRACGCVERSAHVLRDALTDMRERLNLRAFAAAFAGGRRLRARRSRGGGGALSVGRRSAPLDVGHDVVARDASARARAAHLLDVDVVLAREAPD